MNTDMHGTLALPERLRPLAPLPGTHLSCEPGKPDSEFNVGNAARVARNVSRLAATWTCDVTQQPVCAKFLIAIPYPGAGQASPCVLRACSHSTERATGVHGIPVKPSGASVPGYFGLNLLLAARAACPHSARRCHYGLDSSALVERSGWVGTHTRST